MDCDTLRSRQLISRNILRNRKWKQSLETYSRHFQASLISFRIVPVFWLTASMELTKLQLYMLMFCLVFKASHLKGYKEHWYRLTHLFLTNDFTVLTQTDFCNFINLCYYCNRWRAMWRPLNVSTNSSDVSSPGLWCMKLLWFIDSLSKADRKTYWQF